MSERSHIDRRWLAALAAAITLVCVIVLTMQIRDRWHAPEIKSADQAARGMTGQVARAAGAQVLPTDPKLMVEPAPPGPTQAQPANPN